MNRLRRTVPSLIPRKLIIRSSSLDDPDPSIATVLSWCVSVAQCANASLHVELTFAFVTGGFWYVYLARCADGSLYCGIARDVGARIRQHDAGSGARYTRGRGPLRVLVTVRCRAQGLALRIERAVKQLTRAEKLALASEPAKLARLVRRVRRHAFKP